MASDGARGDAPLVVVVPAHDEEAVIGRCLSRVLSGAEPGDLTVVVVSNGSTDATVDVARAELARTGAAGTVVDLPTPSKIAAVREGLRLAGPGTVVVLDADVEVEAATLRSLHRAMDSPRALVGAATLEVDARRSSWLVRRYYRAWTALPYVATSMVGSGLFALNEAARSQLGELPDVINDDGWVRRSFAPEQRVVVPGTFRVHAARTVRALVARRARIAQGNHELGASLGRDPGGNSLAGLVRLVRAGVVAPVDALAFVLVTAASRLLARVRRSRQDTSWSTDRTSRVGA